MAGMFPPSGGGGEVVVHRVEATEKRTEVLVAERDQQGEARPPSREMSCRRPSPTCETRLRRHPDALAGFQSSRHPYDMTSEVGARSERRDQPLARRMCVLDRLERRHRLRDDDEERLGRIEILRRHGKVVRVHVRDETHGELAASRTTRAPAYAIAGPRSLPPIPMFTTARIRLPVAPTHSPDRTASANADMRSSSSCTSLTTSTPSTTSDRERGIRRATWSAGRPSETFTGLPRNIECTFSASPRSAASFLRSWRVSSVTRCFE